MIQLIRLFSLRHARKHFARTFLTVSGVALGVAVVLAIQAVNHSILESFRKMIDAIAGRTTLQVASGALGVPESLWEEVENIPGVTYVTPVIQQTVRIPELGDELVLLLGIDFTGDEQFRDYSFSKDGSSVDDPLAFLNDPSAILLSKELARKYGKKEGSTLGVLTVDSKKTLTVRGLLEAEGPARGFGGSLIVMDIFAAQALWGKEGRFDRLDLITDPSIPVDQMRKRLKERIGGEYKVELPRTRGDSAQNLLKSFQTGLNVGGFVALLVGLFLIYNTMQIAVTQRRREIGIARSLGALRSDMIRLFVGEALVLGAAGSVLGTVVGLQLARALLTSVSGAVSMHFLKVNPDEVLVSPWIITFGLLSGVVAAALAALRPAMRAASVSPVDGIRFENEERLFKPNWKSTNALLAYLFAGIALLMTAAEPFFEDMFWGYVAQLAAVLAFAFLSPTLLVSSWRAVRPLAHRLTGPSTRLAFDQLPRHAVRTAVTISAIMLAFGMVVEIDNYITSIKTTLMRWVNQTIPADLFVTSGSKLAHLDNQPMRETLADDIGAWPEVEDVDRVRIVDVEVDGLPVPLLSNLPDVYLKHVQREFLIGNKEVAKKRLKIEPTVVVAENFLRRFHRKVGDSLEFSTPKGKLSLEIIGAVEDYTSDRGLLIMSRQQFSQHFDDKLVDSFDVYLKDRSQIEPIRQRILQTFGRDTDLFALTNQEMKTEIFRIVDETYKVVYVMEIIAVLVSLLGIANTLLASVLERTREIGMARAIGATRRQVIRMVVAEGGYLALGGMILGSLLGIVLTQILLRFILVKALGWTIGMYIPYVRLGFVAVLGLLLSLLSAYIPARYASRLNIVKAIEYE